MRHFKSAGLTALAATLSWYVCGTSAARASEPTLIQCPDAAAIIAEETTTKLRSHPAKQSFAQVVQVADQGQAQTPLNAMKSGPLAPGGISTSCLPKRVQVEAGDTLSKLAGQYLGDAKAWTRIEIANPGLTPTTLRAGQTISIPCAASAPVTATQLVTASVKAGVSAETVTVSAPVAQVAPVAPPPPPLPVWTARAGEYFTAVARRWGKAAGYQVLIQTTADWKLAVPVNEQGHFEDVLKEIVSGLGQSGPAPLVRIYPNHVLSISGGQ